MKFTARFSMTHAVVAVLFVLASNSMAADALTQNGGSDVITPEQILQQYGIGTDTATLLLALKHDNALVRQMAVTIIGESGNDESIPQIRVLLDDPNGSVRVSTAEALVKLGDTSGYKALQKELTAPGAFDRLNAASSLCDQSDDSGHAVIEELLTNEKAIVRVMAVVSLGGCVTFPKRLETLSLLVKDSNEDVRIQALEVLALLGSKAIIPVFINVLTDAADAVRYSANEKLVELTGQNMGYEHWASSEERGEAIQRWTAWWKRHREHFQVISEE